MARQTHGEEERLPAVDYVLLRLRIIGDLTLGVGRVE